MSFEILYPPNLSDDPQQQQRDRHRRPLSLSGLVGRDGQVYWLEETVAELFFGIKTIPVVHHPRLPYVYDVTGDIPIHLHRLHHPQQRVLCHKRHYFRNWFLKRRVLTHAQLCQAFGNYSCITPAGARIRHFGDLLNDRDTHVVEGKDPKNHTPVLCIQSSSSSQPASSSSSSSSLVDLERFLKEDAPHPVPFFVWLAWYKLRIKETLYDPSSPVPLFTG